MKIFESLHHVALICSDLEKAKIFYVDILGFKIIQEIYREERQSYKVDLEASGVHLELFTFPDSKLRLSRPEAQGLRHLAFASKDINYTHEYLVSKGIDCEEIRVDPHTSKKFFFCADPDQLPIEFYESSSSL